MRSLKTLIGLTLLVSLAGCASWRGGPPSCDGSARRPVGSVPDRTSLAPGNLDQGGRHGQG